MRSATAANSGSASARMRLLLLLVDAIGRPQRTDGTGDKRVGFAARIGAVTSREKGAAEDLGRADELADEHHRRHRQELAAGNQRRAPALDAFGKARILRALSVADVLAPFAARYLEEIAGLAPARHHPVEMGPDQPIDALPGPRHRIERGQHRGVIVPQHLQEQRTRQLLLRSEDMKEAAVGGACPGADRCHRRSFKADPVEYEKPGRQQVVTHARRHRRLLEYYSRVML